jgi:uncharacterized protein YggE
VTANKEKTMKLARIGVVVLAAAAAVAFVGVGLPQGAKGDSAPTHGITVNGVGKVSTVPDRATFTFGVETHRSTAADASDANNGEMRRVIDALKAAGVADADMQTSQISVYPEYKDSGSGVSGYVASNSVTVTVGIADAGSVVQAAVGAGANQVDGPSLTKDDSDALYAKALRDAVDDARARAQVLADAAGVTLGGVISIEEGSEPSGPIAYDMALASPERAPIEPGKQDVEADITVTFAIA